MWVCAVGCECVGGRECLSAYVVGRVRVGRWLCVCGLGCVFVCGYVRACSRCC